MLTTYRSPLPARRLNRPRLDAIDLLREYLEYRRGRRALASLSDSLLSDIGVTRLEVAQAASSFAAWRASRFGRGGGAATLMLAALAG